MVYEVRNKSGKVLKVGTLKGCIKGWRMMVKMRKGTLAHIYRKNGRVCVYTLTTTHIDNCKTGKTTYFSKYDAKRRKSVKSKLTIRKKPMYK